MAAPPPSSSAPPQNNVLRGAFWAVLAATFHALVPVGVRYLSDTLPAVEIVFLRNGVGLSAFLCWFAWKGFGGMRTSRIGLHSVRNLMNFVGMWFWFAAIGMMPLGQAVALHFTVPLMAVVLAVIFLRERPGLVRWMAVAVGFGGVMIILRPGEIEIGTAALLVLGSALLYAGCGILSRTLGRTEQASVTTFFYLVTLTACAAPFALTQWVTPDWSDLPAVLLLAAAGTAAPYCLFRAYRYAEASIVSPIDFLRLPLTTGCALLLFGETTDVWTWVGGAVIFGSTWFMTWRESRRRRQPAKPAE
ncbi:MAG: EamA family transporter [Alphaproteobacteria bacterium]|nr:EamA family transporter [Alphaproteobacteria bacterium]